MWGMCSGWLAHILGFLEGLRHLFQLFCVYRCDGIGVMDHPSCLHHVPTITLLLLYCVLLLCESAPQPQRNASGRGHYHHAQRIWT